MCPQLTLSMGSLQLHDSHTRIPCNRVNVHSSVVAACANQVWQIQLRRGLHRKAGSPCLTGAFELGHRPVSAPSSRRHHAIGRSPLNAPPGRCRSTLSLGPIRAPTHRKPAWRLHLASSSLFDGPVPAVLPQISSCPGLQRTGVVRAGRYLGGRGRGVWVSVAKPRPLSRQSPFRHHHALWHPGRRSASRASSLPSFVRPQLMLG